MIKVKIWIFILLFCVIRIFLFLGFKGIFFIVLNILVLIEKVNFRFKLLILLFKIYCKFLVYLGLIDVIFW